MARKTALDRLRELAAERGQTVKEYSPRAKAESASTSKAEGDENPATQRPPLVRGPLPPQARACVSSREVSSTSGGPNMAQRIVLISGFLVILGMVLFPPWIYVFSPSAYLRDRFVRTERSAGYHLLFTDHSPRDLSELTALFSLPSDRFLDLALFSIRLDTGRLQIQIAATLILTAILYFALRPSKDRSA